jgi:hypothetical protein
MQVAAFVSARTYGFRTSAPLAAPIDGPRRAMVKVIRGVFAMASIVSATPNCLTGTPGGHESATVRRG